MGNIYHSVHLLILNLLKRSALLALHPQIHRRQRRFIFIAFALLFTFCKNILPFLFQQQFPQLTVLYDWKIFLLDTIDGTFSL
jgi:hypothetical protein